jgi:hypothetical protein
MSLADELRAAGVENIDDAVNQHFDDEAAKINNSGLDLQILWLKSQGWSDEDIRRFYQTEAET